MSKFIAIFQVVGTHDDVQNWYWLYASSPTEAKELVAKAWGETNITDCFKANGTPSHRINTKVVIPRGQYEKRNCRWATVRVQANNKRHLATYTYAGETKSLTAWAKDARCVVPFCTLHKRVRVYGFDFVKSLTCKSGELK